MKKEVVTSLAQPVGNLWKSLQNSSKSEFFVASPLSSTPIPIYKWIVEHASEFQNWDKVRFVLMDEMLENDQYVTLDDPASYENFARNRFLHPLKEKTGVDVPVLKPEIGKIGEFNQNIDLLVLALGVRGNYANVMPGAEIQKGWHISRLLPEFQHYHEGMGYEGSKFREFGMSLGPLQVLLAKNVIVIISGERKKELAEELFSHDSFDPQFPLSIIYHPQVRDRVQIFITQDAV